MKSFIIPSSGERAYIPTEDEKTVIMTALKHFESTLPRIEEGLDNG